MYVNYGDKNFFDYGCLVDTEHSDTEFQMLLCRPYDDEEDLYQFNEVTVNIDDDWIDRKAVMDYIGMSDDNYSPILFAIGCTNYYSWDNFGIPYAYDWQRMNKSEICKHLRHHLIASDNLDIEW